jgi:hypothetical protein
MMEILIEVAGGIDVPRPHISPGGDATVVGARRLALTWINPAGPGP